MDWIIQEDYYNLHEYSITKYEFWNDLWEFFGVVYSARPSSVSCLIVPHYLITTCTSPDTSTRLKALPSNLVSWRPPELCWKPSPKKRRRHRNYLRRWTRHNKTYNFSGTKGIGWWDGEWVEGEWRWRWGSSRWQVLDIWPCDPYDTYDPKAIVTNSLTAVVIALATASIGAIFSSTVGIAPIINRAISKTWSFTGNRYGCTGSYRLLHVIPKTLSLKISGSLGPLHSNPTLPYLRRDRGSILREIDRSYP